MLLGATGSIGRATLDVIKRHPECFEVVALAAYSNAEALAGLCYQFHPQYACLADPASGQQLSQLLKDERTQVLLGESDMVRLAELDGVDLVVNAIVGAAGLHASLTAIRSGKYLALANKESLVAGGPLFEPLMKSGGRIFPVDSEHSAVWQALACGKPQEVRTVILTASGGPFRDYSVDRFDQITPEQALAHPTWKMGPKITVDSATLANKGLEVIEATVLFSLPVDKVKVLIHPESIIHSMVEFVDSAIIAQISKPDMRLPITYALFWPDRVESEFGRLDPAELTSLTFDQPDMDRFPALRLAYEAANRGGTAPAVFNAANEVAVGAFLNRSIRFTEIADTIDDVLERVPIVSGPNLEDILAADQAARTAATRTTGRSTCC